MLCACTHTRAHKHMLVYIHTHMQTGTRECATKSYLIESNTGSEERQNLIKTHFRHQQWCNGRP